MSPVLSHAEARVPNADVGLLRERRNFQKEQGADGSAYGRNRPADRRGSRPVLTRHLFGILTKAFGRPRTPSPLSALLLSRNLLFFKVFLPKCDVLQAPQPISLLLHRTDETIHLPAPHSLAPPCPHSPTHPRTWLRPRSPGGRRRTDCLNQRRRLGGAAAFPPPVQTTACRPILPRGRNIFEAAPEFGERKIRVVSDLILT